MTSVAIEGVGTVARFGLLRERTLVSLAIEAIEEALRDARVARDELDAVWVGGVFVPPGTAQRALRATGITGIPMVAVENACASGTSAFHEAVCAVREGRYRRVLALGLEQLSTIFDGAIVPESSDPEGAAGLALPALYALTASMHAHRYGTTSEQLALVAVKNRANGALNPHAQQQQAVTLEEVLASRPIADPLTLLMCCPLSDGAAAAVLGPGPGEVEVLASALVSGELWDHRSVEPWGYGPIARAAVAASRAAGLEPWNADLLEVHDAFTIGELVAYEALGLCPLGESGALVESGATAIGGAHPVNPSGGLIARGHPLGATGLAQIAEVVWQLRGACGERQVHGARIGLVETMGGGAAGLDGNACVVVYLGAPERPH